MFGFLKKGLKKVAEKFREEAEDVEERHAQTPEIKEQSYEHIAETTQKEPAAVAKETETAEHEKATAETQAAIKTEPERTETTTEEKMKPAESVPAGVKETKEQEAPIPKKKGLFSGLKQRLGTVRISREKFDRLFNELEITLLENNVALDIIDKIRDDLSAKMIDRPLSRGKVEATVSNSLKESIESLFVIEHMDFISKVKQKKPCIIVFTGINGSGKTTTIAKVARILQKEHLQVVLAAADTFRAAAIQQLQEHADRLGIRLIRHDYGSDPAAVAFDAVKHAEANNADAVLIDTAGRLHSNKNLMEEMKKIVRVAKPDLKVFVGESITGNDCVEQAKIFNETIGIDGIILAKADVDEKGGAAISVSYVTRKPILYLGTGQGYDDIQPFSADTLVRSLGLA